MIHNERILMTYWWIIRVFQIAHKISQPIQVQISLVTSQRKLWAALDGTAMGLGICYLIAFIVLTTEQFYLTRKNNKKLQNTFYLPPLGLLEEYIPLGENGDVWAINHRCMSCNIPSACQFFHCSSILDFRHNPGIWPTHTKIEQYFNFTPNTECFFWTLNIIIPIPFWYTKSFGAVH